MNNKIIEIQKLGEKENPTMEIVEIENIEDQPIEDPELGTGELEIEITEKKLDNQHNIIQEDAIQQEIEKLVIAADNYQPSRLRMANDYIKRLVIKECTSYRNNIYNWWKFVVLYNLQMACSACAVVCYIGLITIVLPVFITILILTYKAYYMIVVVACCCNIHNILRIVKFVYDGLRCFCGALCELTRGCCIWSINLFRNIKILLISWIQAQLPID